MNSQELFLDVASGRFLDGATSIPSSKPSIYSDEQRRFRLNVYKVRGNSLSGVTPSNDSRFKVRIGTSALKLADGIDVPTAPDNLITAVATVVTAASSQAVGLSKISTYTPVTASLLAGVVTYPIVTAGFSATIDYKAPVTATVSVGIGTVTLPGLSIDFSPNISGITDVIKPPIFGRVLSFTTTLNTPDTATFAAVISGGSVATISLVNSGIGYLNGTYPLSFSTPNPTRATFTATISAGSVTTISIVTGGSGYGAGPFSLEFTASTGSTAFANAYSLNGVINSVIITDSGTDYSSAPNVSLATPSAVKAIATVIASQDKIQSITLVSGGSGYAATPTVTMFTPAKRVVAVEPTNKISNVVSGSIFSWANGLSNTAPVGLLFSSPDNITTPTPISVPSAFIYFQSGNTWKLQLISSGYGYTTAPTVIHNDVLIYDNTVDYGVDIASFTSSSFFGTTSSLRSIRPKQLKNNKSGRNLELTTNIVGISRRAPTTAGTLISFGGVAPEYRLSNELFSSNGSDMYGYNLSSNYRVTQNLFPSSFIPQLTSPIRPVATASIFTVVNLNTRPDSSLAGLYPNEAFVYPRSDLSVVRPLELKHELYAGRDFFAALIPETSEQPSKYAVCKITIPPANENYRIYQNGYQKQVAGGNNEGWVEDSGGGILEPKIRWIDYGSGYTNQMMSAGLKLFEISSLPSPTNLLESFAERTITAVTSFLVGGYVDSIFSRPAAVATRPGQRGVQFFLSDGGLGYYKNTVLSVSQASISGGVITASITNQPVNYNNGTYICSVATAPGVGITAQVSFTVSGGAFNAIVLNAGFGYATAPAVTAPSPNFQSGQVVALSVVTQPFGYSLNTNHPLSFSSSSVSGGDAQASFIIDDQGNVQTQILNQGFGYSSIPSVVAKDPDLRSLNGYVGSIQLSNSPEGYVIGREYPLTIQQSPSANGTARANLIKVDSSRFDVAIVCRGFGYTSAPLITAPAPDKNNGILSNVSVTTFGKGYSPGTYQCFVTTAPAGGETADVSFIVTDYKNASFVVNNQGYGYTAAPTISVPTPSGRILSSISIACAGSFYTPSTATFSLIDDTGEGATFKTIVSSGRVIGVQVANPGYGFSDKPIILFSSPIVTPLSDALQNQVDFDLNITVASANAILSTATQKDILMEVYETDGTNEQVVAQATVSLSKRVLE